MHKVHQLTALGQSVWLDFLNHAMLASGELDRLVHDDGVRGQTSNPTIFAKAIAGTNDYDELLAAAGLDEPDPVVLERLMTRDIALACDAFRSCYETTGGRDGFVSVEVPPAVAYDTLGSIDAARRLWSEVARPNVMVKIPGTREGLLAIERCLADGLNINITLLFSVERYEQVANAYLRALEARKSAGKPIDRVASVASFFVSRVDTKIDAALDRAGSKLERGRAGIDNARVAYEAYGRIFSGARWRELAEAGARPQRLLWASTSTKNPSYGDLHYVDALVAPDTIDTMPMETLRAFIDHGEPEVRIGRDLDRAHRLASDLAASGIDLAKVMQELEDEGVKKFGDSFAEALAKINEKRRQLRRDPDIAPENAPKKTEFGDREATRAITHADLRRIP